MTWTRRLFVVVVIVALGTAPVLAHVPAFTDDNTTPGTAHEIDPPTKSWAIYDSLSTEQVRYYELHLEAGQRLDLELFTPSGGPFTPQVVIMSPALDADDEVPDRVTVPDGYGTRVVSGEKADEPSFEFNAPAANYRVLSFSGELDRDARILVAVYEPDGRPGQVGVVAGSSESFTVAQYVGVAWDLPRIYLWEGYSPLLVAGPPLAVLVGGLAKLREHDGLGEHGDVPLRGMLAVAGLLIAGSAATMAIKLVFALAATGLQATALVTLTFIVIPLLAGAVATRRAFEADLEFDARTRAKLGVAGLAGLATWAGYVLAPLVLLAVAVAPRRVLGR